MKFFGKLMIILIITLGLLLIVMVSGCTENNSTAIKEFCEKRGWNYNATDSSCWVITNYPDGSSKYYKGLVIKNQNGTLVWKDLGDG
jgi:hypothetical protein